MRDSRRSRKDLLLTPLNGTSRRYSEQALHSAYQREGGCSKCLTRVPYATLVATVMCIVGVGVFCGTMHRGSTLTVIMMDQVFKIRAPWMEAVQLVFTSLGAVMGAIGLMILFVGVLATGATRTKVYNKLGARVGGRISCVIFMGLGYVLNIVWLLILCFLVVITLFTTISWFLCTSDRVLVKHECIDLSQFDFMFPNDTYVLGNLKICDAHEMKLFCKDFVEKAEVMFIIACVSAFLVILSLTHYLMCLSANYAHIRDHSKFQELQELQILNGESEILHDMAQGIFLKEATLPRSQLNDITDVTDVSADAFQDIRFTGVHTVERESTV